LGRFSRPFPRCLISHTLLPSFLCAHRIRQKGLETALSVPKSLPHPAKARDVAITTIAISYSPTHKRTFLPPLHSDLANQSIPSVSVPLSFVRTFRALKKRHRCKNVDCQTGFIQKTLPRNLGSCFGIDNLLFNRKFRTPFKKRQLGFLNLNSCLKFFI
jgi:hypothetical protein